MNTHILWIIDHIANSVIPHTHDFYQMIFCQKKGGNITIGDKSYEAKQDYAYFIKPGTTHSITQHGSMKTIDLKFFIHNDELCNFLDKVPDEFQISDITFMKMIFLFIAKEGVESKIYCDESTNSALKLLLIRMVHEFNNISNSTEHSYQVFFKLPNHTKSNTDILILDLENYIKHNLHKNITLEELADTVNLNKTYFVKRFKILYGVSPKKFVFNMRIDKAKQLILEGKLAMQEIAYETGFNSLHYFSAAFKQSEGLSPTDYLKYFNKR